MLLVSLLRNNWLINTFSAVLLFKDGHGLWFYRVHFGAITPTASIAAESYKHH